MYTGNPPSMLFTTKLPEKEKDSLFYLKKEESKSAKAPKVDAKPKTEAPKAEAKKEETKPQTKAEPKKEEEPKK